MYAAREHLLSKLALYEYLSLHAYREAATEYMLKIGCYEYDLNKKRYQLDRLKAEVRILKARATARQGTAGIKEELDRRFEAEEVSLKSQQAAINDALAYDQMRASVTPQTETHANELYRSMLPYLHPYFFDTPYSERDYLFTMARDAYAQFDVSKMQVVAWRVSNAVDPLRDILDPGRIEEMTLNFNLHSIDVEHDTEHIETSFPMNQRSLLADETRIAKRRDELYSHEIFLDSSIDSYRFMVNVIRKRLQQQG